MSRPSAKIQAVGHTDASLSGLGATVKITGEPARYYSARAPTNFNSSLSDAPSEVFVIEIYGAILGASRLSMAARGRVIDTLFFIDNNAALVAILRGHCNNDPMATRAIYYFWEIQHKSLCPVWLERVRSSWNEADAPSRGKSPRGAQCVELEFPFFACPF